jgi:glycosyltransferase involved in cell wall biosynthesis
MSSPKISIIINCKNGESFLEDTLKSLDNQEFTDFEVIFYDSESSDNSVGIFKRYKKENYIYIKGCKEDSLAVSRNKAVQASKGKWLCFNDQDDIFLPNRLSEPMKYADQDPSIKLIYSSFEKIDERNKSLGKSSLRKSSFSQVLLGWANIGLLTLTIKKDCFEILGGFDERFPHSQDYDLVLKVMKKYKFHFINKVLAQYRIHENSMSTNMIRDGSIYLETAKIAASYLPRLESFIRIFEMLAKYSHRRIMNIFRV